MLLQHKSRQAVVVRFAIQSDGSDNSSSTFLHPVNAVPKGLAGNIFAGNSNQSSYECRLVRNTPCYSNGIEIVIHSNAGLLIIPGYITSKNERASKVPKLRIMRKLNGEGIQVVMFEVL